MDFIKLIIKIVLVLNMYICLHFKFDNIKWFKNTNLKINPYYYIKNSEFINIFFIDNILENKLTNILEIRCLNNVNYVYRSKTKFKIEFLEENVPTNLIHYIKISSNKIYYNINNISFNESNFICNLKHLEINFITNKFLSNSYITNIQLFDNEYKFNEKIFSSFEFLTPLLFVNLRQENINSKFFKNNYNLYFGGINNNLSSYYDKNKGSNWILSQNNQFINLDNKIFSVFNSKLLKNFTFYVNFDIIQQILNKNNFTKYKFISLYTIFLKNKKVWDLGIFFRYINNELKLTWNLKNEWTIFFNSIMKNKWYNNNNNNNIKNLGIKFISASFSKNTFQKFYVGFKNDSIIKKETNLHEYINDSQVILFKLNKYDTKDLTHIIGNTDNNNPYSDTNVELYLILNEYSFFTGINFDRIEKSDNNYFLIINSKDYHINISNDINLDRKYSLDYRKEEKKCLVSNCIICDKKEICIFCYYNYYWNKNNRCIFNEKNNFFTNENSQLIKIKNEISNEDFVKNLDSRILKNNQLFNDFNLSNTIVYLNLEIKSSKIFKFLKFKLYDTIIKEHKIYFEESNEYKKSWTLYFTKKNNFSKFLFQIESNKDYEIKISKSSEVIDCLNIENIIFFKNIDCSKICLLNKYKYYYKKIDDFKGKCVKEIEKGYYNDFNENIILKCPNNCNNCHLDNILSTIICDSCIKGYKLDNNICNFKNEFDCSISNKNNYNEFGKGDFKICKEFCNICNLKNGVICSIINYNFDTCDPHNIKVIKNKEFIPDNSKCNSFFNNICISCVSGYFLENNYCWKCKNNCLTCNNSFTCNKCKIGYFLKNNNCYLCNSLFPNCNKCTHNKCFTKNSVIILKNNCNIENCNKCSKDNFCSSCNSGFELILNKCICNTNKNNFLNNTKCLSCNKCNFCILNNKGICNTCVKCTKKIKLAYTQKKNELRIFYNNSIKINESPLFFKIKNSGNYIILFKFNLIIIKFFDEIKNIVVEIDKNLINSSEYGYYENQNIKLNNYYTNIIIKTPKTLKKELNIKKYRFSTIDTSNKLLIDSVKYSTKIILYSDFLIIFMPLINLLKQSSLIILLNTNIDSNLIDFLKFIQKNNYSFINDLKLFNNKDYTESYIRVKNKFKENLIIGDINMLDIEIVLIVFLLLIYKIIILVVKNNKFIDKYSIYIKYIYFTMIQNNLIKFYYIIIFYIEIFYELNNGYNKLCVFIFLQFFLILTLFYLNNNYFYCKLFSNPFFNYREKYKENKLIKFFVWYRKKNTRNYLWAMNLTDFFLVLVFMEFKQLFLIQIILVLSLVLFKLNYLFNLFRYNKNYMILTEMISISLLFAFYILFFLNHFFNNKKQITFFIILFFIILNIWELFRIILFNFYQNLKIIKKKKFKNLKYIYSIKALNKIKFNIKFKKFISQNIFFTK